jgi:hypothetical protein
MCAHLVIVCARQFTSLLRRHRFSWRSGNSPSNRRSRALAFISGSPQETTEKDSRDTSTSSVISEPTVRAEEDLFVQKRFFGF